jgi:GPI mannosyltransferase 1 subunit M
MTTFSLLSFPSLPNVLLLATVLRISLISYSEWHDARSLVKYTDVDYRVFSDAAAFLIQSGPGDANQAQGPLKQLFGYQLNIGECVAEK